MEFYATKFLLIVGLSVVPVTLRGTYVIWGEETPAVILGFSEIVVVAFRLILILVIFAVALPGDTSSRIAGGSAVDLGWLVWQLAFFGLFFLLINGGLSMMIDRIIIPLAKTNLNESSPNLEELRALISFTLKNLFVIPLAIIYMSGLFRQIVR